MTARVSDLPEALVRKRMAEMIETCRQTNTKPSVLKLAQQLGLSNTTFRRRFPDIAQELGTLRSTRVDPANGPTTHDRLIARNAKLRRRNQELTSDLALAVAQLQQLSLTNEQLRKALEDVSKVTSIHSKRGCR
jgi:DNA-binding transcriptional regulator YhcF (GntR family)